MKPNEADDLFDLITRIFPGVDTERVFRIRSHFYESGLDFGRCREMVMRHRETHRYFEEIDLLAEINALIGKVEAVTPHPEKIAAEQLAARREVERQELEAKVKADEEACRALLGKLSPEEIREKHPGAAVVLKRLNLLPREGLVFGMVLAAKRESVQA